MKSIMPFESGTIFLIAGALAPASLILRCDSLMNGWDVVEDSKSVVDKQMRDAGWTFFFLAGEMKATTFRFDRERALAAGLKRLAEMTKALRCNSFEISRVTHKLFLGVSRVRVSCHARHLQQGHLFSSE
jgi:hypothetical protein